LEEVADVDDMWLKMVTCVRKVASEEKETWWWNDEVQRAIKERRSVSNAFTSTRAQPTSRAID
jgi:hypothetical protein